MLYIKTFGEFDAIKDAASVFQNVKYPYRLTVLLKYFITYHDKKLSPENIIENLFIYEDYYDPKAVLRTQVFRLKKYIKLLNLEEYISISFFHGYYIFKMDKEKCTLDFDRFVKKINFGNSLKEKEPSKAIEAYMEAIELYNGDYLDGSGDEDWVIPVRNKYERLYLQGVSRTIELLDREDRYGEIIEISEKALELHPYNESLNIYFIDALLNSGEIKYAFSHYEYITTKMYRDLNIIPSDEMKVLYKKIMDRSTKRNNIEPFYVDRKFKIESDYKGVLQCDSDNFVFLYSLEKRRASKDGQKGKFLGIITLHSTSYEDYPIEDFLSPMEGLKNIMLTTLKTGDVFTVWNEKQVAFILSNVEYNDLYLVRDKIIKEFNLGQNRENFYIFIEFKHITNE